MNEDDDDDERRRATKTGFEVWTGVLMVTVGGVRRRAESGKRAERRRWSG